MVLLLGCRSQVSLTVLSNFSISGSHLLSFLMGSNSLTVVNHFVKVIRGSAGNHVVLLLGCCGQVSFPCILTLPLGLAISHFGALDCFPSQWVLTEPPIAFKQLHCCGPFCRQQLSLRRLCFPWQLMVLCFRTYNPCSNRGLAVQGLLPLMVVLIMQTPQAAPITERAPVETASST